MQVLFSFGRGPRVRSIALALFTGAFACGVAIGPTSVADAIRPDKAIAAPGATPHRDEETVVVFNRPIVRFRAPLLGISPQDRAETAGDRVHTLLDRGGEGKVTVDTIPQGAAVRIDGQLVFVVTHEDVDNLGADAVATAAGDAAHALERVIAETREARNTRAMLTAAGWAGVATLVYLLLLWLLHHAIRFIGRRLLRFADAKGDQLRAAAGEIVQRDRVLDVIRRLLRVALWTIGLLFTYKWLGFVLARFPFTRPWGEQLDSFLLDTTLGLLAAIAHSVPGLLVAVVIFVLARWINGLLRNFFDGVQSGRIAVNWLDGDTARPTRRLATIAVWLFAIAMAYPYIPGAQTDAFKGLSVLLGLMVSVGASGIIGQAASGLILMYTRTFRPGEYVRISDSEGTVVLLGLFTTRIRTGLGEELTVPNSMVLGTVTRNYSRTVKGAGFVLDTAVTIGYDAPWRQVHAMLIEAAGKTAGVLADPPPRVFQTALSDFYVEYRLVCQAVPTEPRPRAEVLSALHSNILDTFNEHGVQIMSPHYLGDPADAKLVPPAKWYAPPAEPPRK